MAERPPVLPAGFAAVLAFGAIETVFRESVKEDIETCVQAGPTVLGWSSLSTSTIRAHFESVVAKRQGLALVYLPRDFGMKNIRFTLSQPQRV